MNKKLYTLYAVVFSLALLACSDDNVSGSSEDPNAVTAEKGSSSSSLDEDLSSSLVAESSSSVKKKSSSSGMPVLCKVSGDWGYNGCVKTPPSGEGDLWSYGPKVKTDAYADDPSKFGERAGELFFATDSVGSENTKLGWIKDSKVIHEFDGLLQVQFAWGALLNPFFDIGFYVAGFDSNGVALSADISNWNGICVMYGGSIVSVLQLDLGDSLNKKMGYVLPSVVVSDDNLEPQCFEWNQFKQPDSEKKHEIISGEDAAKHVEKVLFHFQPIDYYSTFDFIDILAIGTNRNDFDQSSSSSARSSSSSERDPCKERNGKERGGKDCVVSGHGNLWSIGHDYVNTRAFKYRTVEYGFNDGKFFFDDGSKQGAKTFAEWAECSLTSEFERCDVSEFENGYLSANVWLEKGNMDKNAYFDFGFYVAGFDPNKRAIPTDISNWNGICVVVKYEASDEKMKLSMQLDLGDSINPKIGNVLPEVVLESSDVAQCFEWNQFKQPGADKIISGEEAAKNVARIIFHIESALETGNMFVFDILAIGTNREE